jgi:hypothetical protein
MILVVLQIDNVPGLIQEEHLGGKNKAFISLGILLNPSSSGSMHLHQYKVG